MKTAFDTNEILFRLLNKKTSINGGVYHEGDRPDNSKAEDIVINTIDLEMDALPQTGTSNVNIYVTDKNKRIGGKMQLSADRQRLKAITNEVLAIIRNADIAGCKAVPGQMVIMAETNTKQHFANIRITWNIQI